MKGTAVIHYAKCSPNSTIASARIARYLAEFFNGDLIDRREAIKSDRPLNTYEYVYFVNSPFLYCDFKEEIQEAIPFAGARCIWVQNEYGLSKYPRIPMVTWSNIPKSVITFVDSYINWNQLTYTPLPNGGPTHHERIRDGVLYYGAWRDDRARYFRRYFRTDLYKSYVSTSSKGAKKFSALGNAVMALPPMSPLIEGASKYALSIYLEDEYTHKVYNSPANRFYELLSAGTAMVFDISCKNTFREAGINISPYIVADPGSVAEALKYSDTFAALQRREFSMEYRAMLDDQVREAHNKLLRCVA